jgi:pyruvate dehydrogenase E2 component (dihydrolipoamide acetyltransferase)
MNGEVLMPRVSDAMEAAIVSRWLRKDGDTVSVGEPLVEVETDKSTVEVVAEAAGVLYIAAAEGDAVAPGARLAEIVPAGAPPPERRPLRGRVRATPLARRLASEAGIELEGLAPGSGPLGRIHRIDVERRLAGGEAEQGLVAPSRAHAAAAARIATAKREIPHYYVTVEADATAALRRKDELAAAGERVTLTDLVAFAAAAALRNHASLNSSWSERGIVRHSSVNLGIAVSLENGDLIVPVVADADRKSLPELAAAIRDVVERTRSGGLSAGETSGGTFTITNLGMYGVGHFHAIINPPESGILAVGAVTPTPAFVAGSLVEVQRVSLSLSADHRVYAGVAAARFLADLRGHFEAARSDAVPAG